MNRIKNVIKKSLLSLTLVGLVGQQAHGLGGRQHVGNFLSTASKVAAMLAPLAYTGLEYGFEAKYSAQYGDAYGPEMLPRTKFLAGIFGVVAGLKAASCYFTSEKTKNVADIQPSRLTYVGSALKCAFPGLLALGAVYFNETILAQVKSLEFKTAGIHAFVLTTGLFLTNMVANKLTESGIRANVISTLNNWRKIKAANPTLRSTYLDEICGKPVKLLDDAKVEKARLELRRIGFNKTVSGLIVT